MLQIQTFICGHSEFYWKTWIEALHVKNDIWFVCSGYRVVVTLVTMVHACVGRRNDGGCLKVHLYPKQDNSSNMLPWIDLVGF